MFKWIKKLLGTARHTNETVSIATPHLAAATAAVAITTTADPKVKKPRAKNPTATVAAKRTAKATPPKQSNKPE